MKKKFKFLLHLLYSRFPRTDQRALTQNFAAGLLQTNQIHLRLHYQELARKRQPLPAFDEAQFRVFSQNGEDGILLLLFSVLGTTNKRCVEICAGAGIECNSANLIINHGWEGYLFDGDPSNVAEGRRFYARCQDTSTEPPSMIHAWITAENINDLIRQQGVTGEIDLFSLDIDGVDYWVWRALDVISPRVIILEYSCLWGPDDAVTVPYDPDFVATSTADGPNYAGASLAAYVKLAGQKGYRLVGCERYGFNAFFLKDGVGDEFFPEVSVASCLKHRFVRRAHEERLPTVRDLKWIRI